MADTVVVPHSLSAGSETRVVFLCCNVSCCCRSEGERNALDAKSAGGHVFVQNPRLLRLSWKAGGG